MGKTTKETTVGNRNTDSTNMPIVPDGWEDAWNSARPVWGGGLNQDQKAALEGLKGYNGAFESPGQYFVSASRRGDHTVDPLTDVGAQTIGAKTGADFMSAYRNPFEDQVVQGALGDLQRQFNLAQTAAGNQQQAAGAFGGSATALQNALAMNDYTGRVANTAGGLRAQGFDMAAGLGQQDASRYLTADQSNQDAALRAAFQNQNTEAQRRAFNVNAMYTGDKLRDSSALSYADMLQKGIDQQKGVFNAGTIGQTQYGDWLRSGLPLFGQQGNVDENYSESKTTKESGGGLGGILGGLGSLASGLGSLGWNPFAAAPLLL